MRSRRTLALFNVLGRSALFVALAGYSASAQITVGPNVHVSQARADIPHFELLGAADPDDPDHLMACSIFYPPPPDEMATIVYASFDGGRTWEPTLDETRLNNSGDPICAYGPDDVAYYVVLTLGQDDDPTRATEVYRSMDGGRTWADPVIMPFIDREFALVDNTDSEYRGSIYINGTFFFETLREGDPTATGLAVTYSRDGVHFEPPLTRLAGGERYILGMGNSIAFSDGTLLFVTDVLHSSPIPAPERNQPNGVLEVVHSFDGGKTLSAATKVNDLYQPSPYNGTSINPYLAVDPGEGPFRDRAYLVWPDKRSGRVEILLTYSSDRGTTWASPVVINDDRFPRDPEGAPDHLMPVVGVTRDGVVGVAWYDRRDNPDGLGWHVRFTASLDGGETWLPSVRVSEGSASFEDLSQLALQSRVGGGAPDPEPGRSEPEGRTRSGGRPVTLDVAVRGFSFQGGHYSGLAVAADGVFHPTWVDNRTGVSQIWTAPITVRGTVAEHGGGEYADLEDVSPKVNLDLESMSFDAETGTLTVSARIKNSSADTLSGRLVARVIELRSELGIPELLAVDGTRSGVGAVLDFTDLLEDGRLLPEASTGAMRLRVRVSDLRLVSRADAPTGILRLKARILASPSAGS